MNFLLFNVGIDVPDAERARDIHVTILTESPPNY